MKYVAIVNVAGCPTVLLPFELLEEDYDAAYRVGRLMADSITGSAENLFGVEEEGNYRALSSISLDGPMSGLADDHKRMER